MGVRSRIASAALIVLVVVGALLGAIAIVNRVETGEWEIPTLDDVVRIAKGSGRPAKTIFLERAPIELRPGRDMAADGVSNVLASGSNKPVKMPGWKGSAQGWKRVVACVQKMFEPFDVTVTDRRPDHDNFVLVVVGGRARDLGIKTHHVGGLAPFNGDVISTPVVYAFSATLGHGVRSTCETIAMEVAHAYGLDHAFECKDVMTYLDGCGAKRFVDKHVRCGEKKPRDCEGGAKTQNSFRHLVRVLGARKR